MVRAYHINQGGPTARTDTAYLLLVGTSTLALIAMLMSSYTCKFAAVTEIKMATNNLQTEAHSIPAYFGIWQVQNVVADQSHHHHHHHDMTVSSSEFIVQETNDNNNNNNSNDYQCIAWGDTLWDESGSVRASKIYSLTATVVGVALWALILAGTRIPLNSNMIFALCTVSLVCEALSALYFEVLGAQPCFQYGLQCHWHVGAYYASAAVLLWMTTAIGFALYQPKLVAVPEQQQQQQGQGNIAQPNGTDAPPNTVVAQGNAGTNHNNSHGHDNSPTTPMDEEVGSAALLQTTVDPVHGQCSGCNNNNNNNSTHDKKEKRSLPGDTDQESISTADTPFRLSSFDDDDDDEEVIDSLDQEVGTTTTNSNNNSSSEN